MRQVSILIQPEGRMQRWWLVPLRRCCVFQSSSSPKAGCNHVGPNDRLEGMVCVSILIQPEGRMQRTWCSWRPLWSSCFNPHPARRPDATTQHLGLVGGHVEVSILIQPEGRMQPRWGSRPTGWRTRVSILIQPEGRMQPASNTPSRYAHTSFNPHPARRPDATRQPDNYIYRKGLTVSILIQPEGRMQRS